MFSHIYSIKHKIIPLLLYFASFFIALIFYLYSLAPDTLWGDSALYQYRAYETALIPEADLVMTHPLYMVIVRLFSFLPFSNFAFRINLTSAFFGALTIANLFLFMRNITKNLNASMISALCLLVGHTFWTHSVIAEVYTTYSFFLSLSLLMLSFYSLKREKRYLYLVFWIAGLNISVHMLASLDLLCFLGLAVVLFMKKELSAKDILIIISLVLIGSSLYGYLMANMFVDTKSIWEPFKSALWGSYQTEVLDISFDLLTMIKKTLISLGLNFPTPNILLSLLGLWILFRRKNIYRKLYLLLFCLLFLNLLFTFRYNVPDQHVFFFPTYFIIAILTGLGADLILVHFKKRAIWVTIILFFSLLPIGVYYKIPSLLRENKIDIGFTRDIPYRDNYTYFLWPSKRSYGGARRYGEEVFRQVEANSLILADHTPFTVLKYIQMVEHKRNDVLIEGTYSSERKPIFDQVRKVYLADNERGYYPDWIFKQYKIVKDGIIFEVEK
jgi:hypothetical protein